MFVNCINFNRTVIIPNSVVNIDYTFNNCTNLNSPIILGTNVQYSPYAFSYCINMSKNIYIHSNNMYNVRSFIYRKNNSKRVNIWIPNSGNTITKFKNTSSSYSIVGAAITWYYSNTTLSDGTTWTDYFYNPTYNIYVYPNTIGNYPTEGQMP